VPGITSAIAVPAYAGIPVTHRGLATHFTVVTGHEDPEKGTRDVDWAALARAGGTLVLLMGVRGLPEISRALVAGGRDAATPAAVVASGTTARQHVVSGTLGTIAELAADVANPAITVVGEVAALREAIAWAEMRPLHGVTVAVTRARAQASALAGRLRDLGATVLETPAIRIEPIADVTIDPSGYDLVCVSSPNTPRLLVDAIGGDARRLAHATIAAIGPGTARALREVGIVADVVAEQAVAEGLLDAVAARQLVPGTICRSALVVGALERRDVLAEGLAALGLERVDAVPVYRTVAEPATSLQELAAVDLVTFSSASTARFLAAAHPDAVGAIRGVSIGPITTAAAREVGITIVGEAVTHDLAGLEAAVVAAAEELRGNP
jgi:uroporphyrinogen III methyltransferase/synthase